jgi:hypothetical protein
VGVVASLPVVASLSVGLGVALGFPAKPALALLAVLGTGLLSVLAYLVALRALGVCIGGRIRRACPKMRSAIGTATGDSSGTRRVGRVRTG